MINIAIIPARSGSKRIKNKNIINFCGKPMIYWPIKTLINLKIFNSVYVSTDSLKIKQIAKKYGAMCTPDPFLFNSQKELVFHGRIDNAMKPDDTATEKTMILNMKKLISGEKIEKDFDPSIGCSIKWKEE